MAIFWKQYCMYPYQYRPITYLVIMQDRLAQEGEKESWPKPEEANQTDWVPSSPALLEDDAY